MSIIEQAQELLRRDPLPADAEGQLDALYAKATADERKLFERLYEALAVLLAS